MTDAKSIAWIGLDAHSKNCVLAQLDDDGTQQQWWRLPTRADALIQQIGLIAAPDKRLVLEESNLARWLSQLLQPHVAQLAVCDARHNRLISSHPNKHDQRDAFNLARLYRLGEIKTVWQPASDERAFFKSAAQAYEDAVVRQTRLKLQIKARFQHWGVFPTAGVYTKAGRNAWLFKLPSDVLRAQLQLLYGLLDQALEGQRGARRLMVQGGRSFPEVARLRTVPGVGIVGSHLFAGYVQDPKRFGSLAQLVRYCRLGIRDRSSDDKPLGFQQLDRHGHGALKAVSYRAWLYCTRQRRGVVWDFFQASLQRTGSPVHARLNTQRKIILTLWCCWREGKEFAPDRF